MEQVPKIGRRLDPYLAGVVLSFLFITLFIFRIDYNGPFIDESFYAYAKRLGNVFFITGDARLWPVLSGIANGIGGYIAARVLAVILGALTAGFLYEFARIFIRNTTKDVDERKGAFCAALLFSASSTVIVTNTIAGYDSLSFMFLSFGLFLMAIGFEKNSTLAILFASLSFTLMAAARFVTHIDLPVVALIGLYFGIIKKNYRLLAIFWVSLLFLTGIYWLSEHKHILTAVAHARIDASKALSVRLPAIKIIKEIFWRAKPVIALAVIEMAVITYKRFVEKERIGLGEIFIFAAGLPIILYHLYNGNNFVLNRNLYLGVIFFSIPAGILLCRISMESRALKYLAIPITILLSLYIALKPIENDRRWPDWRPVVQAVRELGIGTKGIVWSTAYGGHIGNVWYLKDEFGDNLDESSAWKWGYDPVALIKLASTSNVSAVIGPIRSRELSEGDTIEGFKVARRISVKNGPDVYILISTKLY